MATAKKSTTTKSQSSAKSNSSDKVDNVAKVAFEKAKDAVPPFDSVAEAAAEASDYFKDQTNIDVQRLANDASEFVRRNPGTSLAAAAGLGILIGVLVTKRS